MIRQFFIALAIVLMTITTWVIPSQSACAARQYKQTEQAYPVGQTARQDSSPEYQQNTQSSPQTNDEVSYPSNQSKQAATQNKQYSQEKQRSEQAPSKNNQDSEEL